MSQCTFWCSVLSDVVGTGRARIRQYRLNAPFGAQCFPTRIRGEDRQARLCLNAPFGAQCFPTNKRPNQRTVSIRVSMHLLVLSAFRLCGECWSYPQFGVSMHLLVLSAFRHTTRKNPGGGPQTSQCTFWCAVFADVDDNDIDKPRLTSQCTFWCSVLSDSRWRI